MGIYGFRSLVVGGSVLVKSIEKVIEKGMKIVVYVLEVVEDDLEFVDGKWIVKGIDKLIGFGDVFLMVYVLYNYLVGLEFGFDFFSFYDLINFIYLFGVYIVIVEVDKDIGKVSLKCFIVVDDVGNVINLMIVDG